MKRFSIKDRLKSFIFAFRGIILLFRHEHNAWIHGMAMILATGLGFYFDISRAEWIGVCLSIGMVLAAEAFNTAIEKIADFVHSEQNTDIGQIKDLAAGGVLLVSIAAFIVGMIVFAPKIIALISQRPL